MNSSILGARDCISGRIGSETLISPIKSKLRNHNPNISSRRRRRSSGKYDSEKSIVMSKVRILKRGETLVDNRKKTEMILGSTDRLGPEPETVKKQIGLKDVMYAGTAFLASPPPSSLPVPGFIGKGSIGNATSDLRRLLRLD